MKKLNQVLTALAVALLAGCGGGGGGTPSTLPVPPVDTTSVTNPLTGAPAPGLATNVIKGTAHRGATVTAYSVQADGSAGAALGAAALTDASGDFVLTLDRVPTGMLRLEAKGGSITRAADNTVQPMGTVKLITPFVTTVVNHFKITPISDIAAHLMAHKAKNGASLTDAFKAGMRSALELDVANAPLLSDVSVYMNALRGSIKSDLRYYDAQSETSGELLMGLEMFGVMYDLPSKDVWRVVAAAGEIDYSLAAVDGAATGY